MIKVLSIGGKNGSRKPEYTPEKFYGCHSDDSFFYFFESDEEKQIFMDALSNAVSTPIGLAVQVESDLVRSFMNATPEEIQIIKNLLANGS